MEIRVPVDLIKICAKTGFKIIAKLRRHFMSKIFISKYKNLYM